MVPVLINGVIELNFTVDSGAADVSIPADVLMTLLRTGTLKDSDFLGTQTYVLADGSRVPSQTFRIRMLKVGDRVIENVIGSVADVRGSLLLGQSFLGKFKSWSVDNIGRFLCWSNAGSLGYSNGHIAASKPWLPQACGLAGRSRFLGYHVLESALLA